MNTDTGNEPRAARDSKLVDLDELERRAIAAEPALWLGLQADALNIDRWADPQSMANAQHIAANSPPVTLALITRIRELEGAIEQAAEAFGGVGPKPNPFAWRAILDKGAVLP